MKKKPKVRKRRTVLKETLLSEVNTNIRVNLSKWIRIDRPFVLPGYVKSALQVLDDAGHLAYVVGGSVRDYLLNRPTKDHDIATSATPDELQVLFPRAITVGKSFGVLKIPIETPEKNTILEIATFRKDLDYLDHRHPTGVLFSGPEEDASRRDFTINALFYDAKTSRILDLVGGVSDLHQGVLRAIGNPEERFREDALRLLRAIRFATVLGFKIEQKTLDAILLRSKLVSKVSAERLRDELTLMLLGVSPEKAILLLSDLDLLVHILPEVQVLRGFVHPSPFHEEDGDVFKQTLRVLGVLARQEPKRSMSLAWAGLLHPIGKPAAGKKNHHKNFNGFEIEGAALASKIAERLRFSRIENETLQKIIKNQLRFRDVFEMREATLLRFVQERHFDELLALHRADATASDGNLAPYEFCRARLEEFKASEFASGKRLLTGEDLIGLGFEPGPHFSGILKEIEDRVFEGKLKSKEEALEYVIKHFVR